MQTTPALARAIQIVVPPATNPNSGGCHTCSASNVCLSGWFSRIATENINGVAVRRRRVARNTCLYREMDHLDTLFVVRFGQFKSIRHDSSGGDRVAHFYMAGDLIGLDAIANERHNFRLTALEDSEVCEFSYAAVKKMMATHPEFQQQFLRSMSIALNEECDHSSVLCRSSLDERFACFLLRTGDKYERLGYSNKSFRLSMTRSDIGSYLGTTVESVSRLIARFNAHYRVSIVGRTVDLYDREYLVSVLARDQPGASDRNRPLM